MGEIMDQYIYQILKNQLAIMIFLSDSTETKDYSRRAILANVRTETNAILDKLEPGGGYWVKIWGKGYYVGEPIVRPVD